MASDTGDKVFPFDGLTPVDGFQFHVLLVSADTGTVVVGFGCPSANVTQTQEPDPIPPGVKGIGFPDTLPPKMERVVGTGRSEIVEKGRVMDGSDAGSVSPGSRVGEGRELLLSEDQMEAKSSGISGVDWRSSALARVQSSPKTTCVFFMLFMLREIFLEVVKVL